MPLTGNVSNDIRELHRGPQYARTRRKFGKAKANKQAIAVALNQKRRMRRKA